MRKTSLFLLAAAASTLAASAQNWHEGDISWLKSTEFASNVNKWNTDYKLSEDDNFFISRVRPRTRFQNTATQVRENLQHMVNDRRLIAWLPFNTHDNNDTRDALPTGIFDQEVFTMWSYVDHWGDWTAPMGQIPGGLSDVAHKNGVAISSLASIPYGTITKEWETALRLIATNCTTETKGKEFGDKAAKMLAYYGHDGVGYNSEFSSFYYLTYLRRFHEYLYKGLKTEYQKVAPQYNLQENPWYDGTDDNGSINFDQGLGSHNYQTWGPLGQERTSLFFNYNWDSGYRGTVLSRSVENAASDTYGKGRNPLYLYCGLNMQGGEPASSDDCWNKFKDYNLSIGLWGAHRINMFFEGRGSHGSTPDAQQATYQRRIENWFTGGTHNPANCPTPLSGSTTCRTDEDGFHGMSTFMTARSTLSWDLSKEAFITYFVTGNGKFFNWYGERQNDNEWYNIGAQDWMPTWRWWWTSKFLGKTASDVPATGLSAAISWNDAWVGGSSVRITGATTAAEYLHLFKTAYELQAGDVIKFVYKLAEGKTDAALALSVNGAEATVAKEIPVCDLNTISDDTEWITKTYTVEAGDGLAGQTLAVIALKYANATALDMYLGEISIKRGTLPQPTAPIEITKAQVLRSHYAGVDAKLIFNVQNDKPAGTVCYNDEVNTAFFKIWSQEAGKEPVLLGITPSWAAMCYSAPFEGDASGSGQIAFGVQAVSLDHQTESEIKWTQDLNSGTRTYSDQITVDKTTIIPNEPFTLKAVDPKRSFKWEIWTSGENSVKVSESNESLNSWTCEGLAETNTYDVHCVGENNTDGSYVHNNAFLVVTDPSKGCLPQILSLTANESTTSIEVMEGDKVKLEYTGRSSNGVASRGLQLKEKFFGVQAKQLFSGQYESFSIAGWLKLTNIPGRIDADKDNGCVWIDVRRYDGSIWPRNAWGWLWTDIKPDGTLLSFHHDITSTDGKGAIENPLVYDFENGKKVFFNPGGWTHFAFTFDRTSSQCRSIIYINGKRVESKWFYYTSTNDDYIDDPYTSQKTPKQTGTTEDWVNASKSMHLDSYISIGGTRHNGRGGGLGFTGVLDDFQIWGRAMTQEDVNASMAGLDGNNLPDGVLAYWDFESDADSEFMLAAKGSKTGAKAGYYALASGASEGEGHPAYEQPQFLSGCPFIPGVDYKIEATPTWKINKTMVTDVTGNDQAGSAIANFEIPGEYTATLTLSNDLGSDKKEFQFITVKDKSAAIDGVEADATDGMRTYTVDDVLFLEVASDGDYDVKIYNVAGMQVAGKTQFVNAGSYMRLNFGGAAGVYLVKVNVNGAEAKTFKVVKK